MQRETVCAVLDVYGKLSERRLVTLTHRERPWVEARCGLRSDEASRNLITAVLRHDFGGLGERGQKSVPEAVRRSAWVLPRTPADAIDDLFTDESGGDGFIDWLQSDGAKPCDD